MTTTLGTLTLSDHLLLGGLDTAVGVVTSSRRTLAGINHVQVAPSPGGRILSLEGTNHYTLSQVEAVRAMSALGQPVLLSHHRGIYQVLITGIEMEQATAYADPQSTDWYSGTITLLEI